MSLRLEDMYYDASEVGGMERIENSRNAHEAVSEAPRYRNNSWIRGRNK